MAILCLTLTVTARQTFGLDLGIGAKAGLNFNRINGKGWMNDYRTNPHAGFFVFLNKKRIGVQVEAIWAQTSTVSDTSFRRLFQQYYNNALDSLEEGSFRFNTISIPLMVNFKLTQKLWLQVGPQYQGTVSMIDKNKLLKSGVDIVKRSNYNMIVGGWLQLGGDAPVVRINTGVRYVFGLNNMNQILTSSIWKTQMVQLHIGITY